MPWIDHISLKKYNSFGINVIARYFAVVTGKEQLPGLLESANDLFPRPAGVPKAVLSVGRTKRSRSKELIRRLFLLGGGSNILLTGDLDKMVLKNDITGIELIHEDEKYVYVQVGAGESWHGFVQYCLGRNWAGVENLSLIPGSVGAAPMQNIGAYGVELKEVFYELEAWDLEDGKIYTFTLNDCRFGYRDSIFKKEYNGRFIILNVTFRLNKVPVYHTEYGAIQEELERMGVRQLSIQAISQAVIHIRSAKLPDPAQIGNAGSFFKNPTVPNSRFAALQQKFPGIIGYPSQTEGAPASGEANPARGEAYPNRAETQTGSEASKPVREASNPTRGASRLTSGASKPSSGETKPVPGTTKLAAGWLIEQCGWKGFRRGDAGCHDRQALVLVNYGKATGREIYDLSEEILVSVQQKFGVTLEREVNII